MTRLVVSTVLIIACLCTPVYGIYIDPIVGCVCRASIGYLPEGPEDFCSRREYNYFDVRNYQQAEEHRSPIKSFYDVVERDIDRNDFKFDVYIGRVVYIVNSDLYYTPSGPFPQHVRTLEKYHSQGLTVVLAPCNFYGAVGLMIHNAPDPRIYVRDFAKRENVNGVILSEPGSEFSSSFKYLIHAARRTYARRTYFTYEPFSDVPLVEP